MDEPGRDEVEIDEEQGFFMISVAAELADMHPQTLRIYEAKGLITPKRSPRNTRLYSKRDVERLRRIQRLTSEHGLNLAGVEAVLDMEARFAEMRDELERMRARARELERRLTEEVDRVRRELGAEIVPYGRYEPDLPKPPVEARPVRVVVRRQEERKGDEDAA
jgi:MerR family transcriptional regulator/heat shock protein HspR